MADVFVNTTREDSLSLINVEAQACGTPVVTFDATGPKETVDDIYSISVTVGDYKKLYNAINKIKGNSFESILEHLIKFVSDKYNIYDNYELYIQLYRDFGK